MKHGRTLFRWLGIGLAMATGCAAAQTTANGPYYATPSWDQTMPASTRFVVLTNLNSQAVLDRETGLVWQRSPLSGTFGYEDAATGCLDSRVGGRYGWRLPAAAELTSLFDPSVNQLPPLPAGHPFTGLPAYSSSDFWTATADPKGSYFLMEYAIVGFASANLVLYVRTAASMDQLATAFCVRGPVAAG